MNSHILSLSCLSPDAFFSQQDIANTFENSLNLSAENSKKLQLIFEHSKIKKRHSVISDYEQDTLKGSFFGDHFPDVIPDTLKRNKIYMEKAPQMASNACKQAIEMWGRDPNQITHVISVSCTGMYAPGIEFGLIESLGLNPSVERLGINFMGCFGAFKGLAIAKALANENLNNRILLVCTELCSLHFQADKTIENFVANALFADGAAAAIIGCSLASNESSLFEIEKCSSLGLKETKDLMSWEISNTGMLMKLSPKVPKVIGAHIASFVKNILPSHVSFSEVEWAIHPGGKAIVEAIETSLALTKEQTESSWDTLKNFGNMSSATFLFILDHIQRKKTTFKSVIGLGFGPGLSMEAILLKANP